LSITRSNTDLSATPKSAEIGDYRAQRKRPNCVRVDPWLCAAQQIWASGRETLSRHWMAWANCEHTGSEQCSLRSQIRKVLSIMRRC